VWLPVVIAFRNILQCFADADCFVIEFGEQQFGEFHGVFRAFLDVWRAVEVRSVWENLRQRSSWAAALQVRSQRKIALG
jgi:hypothetical protein